MKTSSFLILLMPFFLIKMASAQQDLTYVGGKHEPEVKTPSNSATVFNFAAFTFDYELKKVTTEMAGVHPFGDEIAKKDYLLEKKYTSEQVLNPGNPQTITLIQKPEIYKAVQRIEKSLKKSVKKGELSVESATYTYNKVLDVALSILTLDTSGFEAALKTANDDKSKIELFAKRVNLIY
jgi:hypothetical protein